MSEPLPTLLIGATGATGLAIVARCRAAGLPVRALVRGTARTAWPGRGPDEAVRGDVLDPASLDAALAGVGAVVCALDAGPTFHPVTLLSTGTLHLIEAMRRAGVARLVCVTGVGAGDSRGHGGYFHDRWLQPWLLSTLFADKDRQEALVRASRLAWTIVRPGRLKNGPGKGRWRVLGDLRGQVVRPIARADVAAFLVRELRAPAHVAQVVNLGG